MLDRPLALLARHAPLLLAGGLAIGLVLPGLAALLRPLLPPFVFCLATASMLRIDWPQLLVHLRQPLRLALVIGWGLLASPVIAAVIVARLPLPPGLAQAVVIWSASPAMISAPALAVMLGLDASLALIAVIAGSLLMPLTLPPIVLGLLGVKLAIGVGALMLRLIAFIGGALTVAAVLRRLAGGARLARWSLGIDAVNVLLLVLFAIAVMDGVGAMAATRPGELALYCGTALVGALAHQLCATLVFFWCGRLPALTVGMICGNRNMASVWASLGVLAPPELTLFLVALQLPIYLTPVALKPLYRRVALTSPGAAQ